jgi:hypothetical protein
MGKMQRQKGAVYERHIANRLREVYPTARRGIGQARSAFEVPDVDGVPFWVECKHRKTVNVMAALTQADKARTALGLHLSRQEKEAMGFDGPPLVVARRNRERDVAAMYLDDLIKLLAEVEFLRREDADLRSEIVRLTKAGFADCPQHGIERARCGCGQ